MGKQLPKSGPIEIQSPRQIYEELDRYVIGQYRAKRTLAIAAYNHYKRIHKIAETPMWENSLIKKSNVLMIGPSGCGKTHIARHLSRILNLPFAVVDATEYTEAGYYGKDVEVMLGELLFAADVDVDQAQQGIIFIDEIDKVARRNHGERTGAGSRDIGGEGVQQSLLKLLEGTTCFVPYNITQHWSKHDFVQMDTTDILFICAGTFSDMKRGSNARRLGFNQKELDSSEAIPFDRRVQVNDLMEFGMITELLGRLPVIVELSELTDDELVKIITDPPDSILKEYKQLMELDEIDLEFPEESLRELAAYARRRKLGARALRTMFEDVMHDIMFKGPELQGQRVVVTPDDVLKKLR